MFVACGIWCLADVSSVSPSSEQTGESLITLVCTNMNTTRTVHVSFYYEILLSFTYPNRLQLLKVQFGFKHV